LTLTKGSASSSTGISGTVAPAVAFEVSEDNFENPANPTDEEVAYGSLDITTLRDNSLSVCGNGGNQKCTKGVIRIYTTGTAGEGLWNAAEGYGLPIKTGSSTIGLSAAGAAIVQELSIASNQRVLHL